VSRPPSPPPHPLSPLLSYSRLQCGHFRSQVAYTRCLQELAIALLDILAQQGSYYQLHQLVQYHIVADSPRLVSQLLALVPEYEPASQLALDMLKRLGPSAHEAILHQLLKQGELLAACRMIRHQRLLSVAPKPFLSAASGSTDPSVFPAVYSFFLQRNLASRGSPEFLAEEQCEEFVLLWERSSVVVMSHRRLRQALD